MQALSAHSPQRRRRGWLAALLVVALVALAGGGAYYLGRKTAAPTSPGQASSASGHHAGVAVSHAPKALSVLSVTPAAGTQNVDSASNITVHLSAPPAATSPMPSLSPPVPGNWQVGDHATLTFVPTAPLPPYATETLTLPGGPGGMHSTAGAALGATTTVSFTVASGSVLRLQQMLAELDYLPLTFTPTSPPTGPNTLADAQPGNLTWRWTTLPVQLQSQWIPGAPNVILQGAVMTYESQHSLTVDGIAGPQVWADLLRDVAARTMDPAPYVYVYVTKVLPENLTLFNNGVAQFTAVPVNTGAPGADTVDGTYPVFEHVPASRMTGTNPDGSHYDDPSVPWASYFHGGDALHGFVRATYGSPQSNGCVEMSIANAATLWPLTPIGTLVTVDGPAVA